jgi:hypothetical protein
LFPLHPSHRMASACWLANTLLSPSLFTRWSQSHAHVYLGRERCCLAARYCRSPARSASHHITFESPTKRARGTRIALSTLHTTHHCCPHRQTHIHAHALPRPSSSRATSVRRNSRAYLIPLLAGRYDPTCRLCTGQFSGDEPTIRLGCLHVFHLRCLLDYAASLPATTAPAGYVVSDALPCFNAPTRCTAIVWQSSAWDT